MKRMTTWLASYSGYTCKNTAPAYSASNEFSWLTTLNPQKTGLAWRKLSRDPFLMNVAAMPRILHQSMLATMKEKGGKE